jgi:predicted secreted protein
MATAAVQGYKGTIRISTDGVTYNSFAEVRDIEVTGQVDMIDATSHDSSGAKEFIPGLSEWSGTIGALYIETNATQNTVRDALLGKTKLYLEFRPHGAVTGKYQYKGECYIKNWKPTSPNSDAAMVNIEMQGTGTLTPTLQP